VRRDAYFLISAASEKYVILHKNVGYTQLLFMGSVPRINYHLAIFLILIESMIVKVALISQKKSFIVISRGNCIAPSYTID